EIGRIQRGQRSDGSGTAGGGRNDFEDIFYDDLAKSSRELGRKYHWDAILPQTGFESQVPEKYQPRDPLEKKWLAEWAAPLDVGSQAPLADKKPDDEPIRPLHSVGRSYRVRYVDEPDGESSYQYYQPMESNDSSVV